MKRKLGALTRRKFVGAAVGGTLLAGSSKMLSAFSATPQRPNVLFILADDFGWGDLSIYGQPNYQTPKGYDSPMPIVLPLFVHQRE